jgi:hypothetical protein
MSRLTIYIDPGCPWAWRTSLWCREIERLGAVQLDWKLFSLAEVNRDPEIVMDPAPASVAHRTLLLARREFGQKAFDKLYLALGHARWDNRGDIRDPAVIAAACTEAGLPADLVERALADESTNEEALAEHLESVERYRAFGVPWLVADDSPIGFYGPVISEVPSGDAALTLWEHTSWFLTQPAFFEIKRPH